MSRWKSKTNTRVFKTVNYKKKIVSREKKIIWYTFTIHVQPKKMICLAIFLKITTTTYPRSKMFAPVTTVIFQIGFFFSVHLGEPKTDTDWLLKGGRRTFSFHYYRRNPSPYVHAKDPMSLNLYRQNFPHFVFSMQSV